MIHPTEEFLLAYLDGEVTAGERANVDRHVAECDTCSASLARLRRMSQRLTSTLNVLDLAEPHRWSADESLLTERAGRGARNRGALRLENGPADASRAGRTTPALRVVPGGAGAESGSAFEGGAEVRQPARPRASLAALRWAAGIVFIAVAAGSAAVIGIPGLQRLTSAGETPETTAVAPAPLAGAAAVAVRPVAGQVDVVLANVADGSRLQVAVRDEGEILVEIEGEREARFQARDGLVRADLGGVAALVRVELPGDLAIATIKVDDQVVAHAENGQVTPAEAATTGGLYLQSGD